MSSSNNNSNPKPTGNSAWSRPLSKKLGGNPGAGGGGGPRPPPGMAGFGSNNNSNNNNNNNSSRPVPASGWGNRGGGGAGNASNNGYAKKAPTGGNSNNEVQHQMRERFLHVILSMVGQTITLTTTTGQVIEGVFHTFSPFDSLNKDMRNMYVIKACKQIKAGTTDNKVEDGSTVVVPSHKVASAQVKSMRLDAANAAEKSAAASAAAPAPSAEEAFQTDSQISGGRGGNQSLVAAGSAWTSAGDGGSGIAKGLGGLEASGAPGAGADAMNWRSRGPSEIKSAPPSGGVAGGPVKKVDGAMSGSIGDWDQFSANEKKFNVKASFDENLYTTSLDVTNIDHRRRKEAERIAKEIEGTTSANIHVAEERNQKILVDYDEEDRYSGVLTKDLKARAVPKEEEEGASDGAKKSLPVMNYAAAANKAKAQKGAEAAAAKDAEKDAGETAKESTEVKETSEEKKVEPDSTATDAKSDKKEETSAKKEEKDIKEESKKPATKLKLNPNAKSFSFNPTAKAFTPSFTVPAPAAAPTQPQPPAMEPMQQQQQQQQQQHNPHEQQYPGGGPQMMGQMGPGGPQYVPGMMPMAHPQMRQQYPPYGAPHPGQQQPMMPPPQGGGVGGQPGQGEDSASVNTGESSSGDAGQQPPQQHQQQQQYMQQGVFAPGSYPGYGYPNSATAAMMQSQGRGGPPGAAGFHPQMMPGGPGGAPQMQVLPGGAMPYGAQRMYGAPPHQGMMQHLPQHAGQGMPPQMHRGGLPHPHQQHPGGYYGGGGPPPQQMAPYPGGQGGYNPQSHAGGDDADHYRGRGGNMGRGGGGPGGRHGNRNNRRNSKYNGGRGTGGRGSYQRQNSQESGSRQSNDASPSGDAGNNVGDVEGKAQDVPGGAEGKKDEKAAE